MYNIKLLNLVTNKSNGSISNILYHDKKLKQILLNDTNFINYDAPISHRVWYIKHNIINQVRCPICSKYTKIDIKSNIPKFCSFSCSINSVNKDTGLTKAQEISLKRVKTMSKIDKDTGLSIYNSIGEKISISINKIDKDTGLTLAKIRGQKSKDTIDNVDTTTKLSIRDKSIITLKQTLSSIDKDTGLTLAKSRGQKSLKINKIKRLQIINDKCPPDYKILTNTEDYLLQSNNIIKYKCLKCESIRESYWPYIRCTTCYPYNKSLGENEILEFCKLINVKTYSNTKQIITPLELDIYLPDHNLAIEYNGLYWHSSNLTSNENQDYHLYKTQECEKQGIQLFHIFENEWQDPQKQKIWKSIISNRLGHSERIFARKTEIRSVSSTEKSEFLKSNHLQGDCMSSVNLGLFLDDELVSLMTFGRSRYDKKIEWELIRFCNKIGCSVVGGASKLLKAFRSENSGSIISYADKRRSSGNLYKKLGFEFSHDSGPNYWYWKDQGLESRLKYQKHKLKDVLNIFDSELTESENMYNNGYHKIYDCGNQVWKLK